MKQLQMTPVDLFGVRDHGKKEIGIEIECEGKKLWLGQDKPIDYWAVHNEPSLRQLKDQDPPVEFVLKTPVLRDKVRKVVEYLEAEMTRNGTVLEQSGRTSVHVHVNVATMTMKQIVTFLVLYIVLENPLVRWCGPRREGNLFCVRCSEADYLVRKLVSVIKKDKFTTLAGDDVRYASVNVSALPKFGSLEFRAHDGKFTADSIDTWVKMLLEVKDKSLTYENPSDVVADFSLHREDFLSRIGPTINHELTRLTSQVELNAGMRLAQEVAYATNWNPKRKDPDVPMVKDAAAEAVVEAVVEHEVPERFGIIQHLQALDAMAPPPLEVRKPRRQPRPVVDRPNKFLDRPDRQGRFEGDVEPGFVWFNNQWWTPGEYLQQRAIRGF